MYKIILLSIYLLSFTSLARVIIPKDYNEKNLSLVVAIHGCLQNSYVFDFGSRWSNLAKEKKFLLFLPDQNILQNPLNCWNWFEPENQKPYSGETYEIIKMIDKLKDKYPIKNVFVVGLSSGAGHVSNLISCYPKYFKGAGIHSGPSYGVASNVEDAKKVLKMGPLEKIEYLDCEPKDYDGKLIVIQGLNDEVVNPLHADRIREDFLLNRYPSKKFELKGNHPRKYEEEIFFKGILPWGKIYKIENMGHAWSGGKAGMKYFDSKGPDATKMMWDFFSRIF